MSTGAESDLDQLTGLARQMVGRWGMSDAIGPLALLPRDGTGGPFAGVPELSPDTQKLIDDEVRRVVSEAHEQVAALLHENRDGLDRLAQALLDHETLDEDGPTLPPASGIRQRRQERHLPSRHVRRPRPGRGDDLQSFSSACLGGERAARALSAPRDAVVSVGKELPGVAKSVAASSGIASSYREVRRACDGKVCT